MTEIPFIKDSGSLGTQEPGKDKISIMDQKDPLEGLPISKAVYGIASARPRSIGGEVAANLISGSFAQLSYELQESKNELKNYKEELNETKTELFNWKEKAAVYKERLSFDSRIRHLKNLGIASGSIMLGLSVDFMRNDQSKLSYIIGMLGLLLISFGWFSTRKEAN